jgi:hypothetical protein
MRDMFKVIKENCTGKSTINIKMGTENVNIHCDEIGEMIMASDCFNYIRYIEEILGVS